MRCTTFRRIAGFTATIAIAGVFLLGRQLPVKAQQVYQNIVNRPFAAVANGPQSALIVDTNGSRAASLGALNSRLHQFMTVRNAALLPELQSLRSKGLLRPQQQIPLVDTVLMRTNGRLPSLPASRAAGRGVPAGNTLTFVVSTTGTYAFDPTTAAQLSSTVNTLLYPALTNLLGAPLWNGQVTILNKDDNPTKVSGIIGVTVVVNTDGSIDIDLPNFTAPQDEYLGLLQAMAQTFYGPAVMGFDAWNTGFARAAASIAAQTLQGRFPNNATVDPAADFYYSPFYDLLNQPALGNSTFFPPTKMAQPISGQFGGMLIPRLQASSTAWIKCYIENSLFFQNFNNAYYDAWQADHTIANDETRLEALASTAVGGSVEGQPFSQWFQQQYVFNAGINPGPKEYVFVTPTLPSSTIPQDGAAVIVLYYNTTTTGDEQDLSGVCNPVFYDYTYLNRLTLPGADTAIQIPNGEGYTAPEFINIGVTPQMRVTMAFPLGGIATQLAYPANESAAGSGGAPSDFFGVCVGSDTGTLSAAFSGGNGTPVQTKVTQGAFGAAGGASIPNNFTKVILTYQPLNSAGTANGTPITFQRNVFQRSATNSQGLGNVSSIFVLQVPGATASLTHVFSSGPQLISLPIQPLNPDLAAVFGIPASQALIAQWNQSLNNTNGDNYELYPNLPLYQPGYSIWTNFASALNGGSGQNGITITGQRTDNLNLVTVGLQYGWNMIGDPFNLPVTLLSNGTSGTQGGVVFQYQGGDALTLTQAISAGYLSAGVFGYNGDPNVSSYVDISQTQTAASPFQQYTLLPWQGYFLLANVTEGLTVTYINPSPNTRSLHLPFTLLPTKTRSAANSLQGWRLHIQLQDNNGNAQTALIGQSPQGSTRYVPALDAPAPPAIATTAGLSVLISQPGWQGASRGVGSTFLSDIQPAGTTTWNVLATVPHPGQTCQLLWPDLSHLPRSMALTLTDLDTNTRMVMNNVSSYSFTTGAGETTRRFQITATPGGFQPPMLIGLHVDLVPGTGGRAVAAATISFQTDAAAQASVNILAANGQVIRHLAAGRAVSAGVTRVVWDLRDDRGRGLSTGVYLAEVRLQTPDGRQTRSLVPCTITR